jgi:pyruvate,water dikinase
MNKYELIRRFSEIDRNDVPIVGGKCASLGEMFKNLSGEAGVPVPNGSSTTADMFRRFLQENNLIEPISVLLDDFHKQSFTQKLLEKIGHEIRGMVKNGVMPPYMKREILESYHEFCQNGEPVAVRSSATAEDGALASFAGQHDTFLNVEGDESVIDAVKRCFASIFNDRAIKYRMDVGFGSFDIALAVGLQRMVRSGCYNGAAGVMFTLEPNSGHKNFFVIESVWGYGEGIVAGKTNTDKFLVSKNPKHSLVRQVLGNKTSKVVDAHGKEAQTMTVSTSKKERESFSITDNDVMVLAGYAAKIEAHYSAKAGHSVPMDIEWAKDGVTGEIFIVQARPETVESRKAGLIKEIYERIFTEEVPRVLLSGNSVGAKVGKGAVHVIRDLKDMDSFQKGDVLVMDMTTPDCEPIMEIASAIITNKGGTTCHAAIISRELDVPAVIGCDSATDDLYDGQFVTVSCAEGDDGFVYEGDVSFKKREIDMAGMEMPRYTKLMLNLGNPGKAIHYAETYGPCIDGIGLARAEHTLTAECGIHPQAILNYETLSKDLQKEIDERIKGYRTPREFYISKLAQSMATMAAAVWPKKVIWRTTDLKTSEFKELIGGRLFEMDEPNPMMGWRGASRYLTPEYAPCFAMECEAIILARTEMGFTNIEVMIPFIRKPEDARDVITLLAANGLDRKTDPTLRIIGMYELPVNAFLADEFLAYFDGFSIGSNDMTQLIFGVDRDAKTKGSSGVNETHRGALVAMKMGIDACIKAGKPCGLCGEAVTNHPELAEFFVQCEISGMSVQHDRILDTIPLIVAAEKKFFVWS